MVAPPAQGYLCRCESSLKIPGRSLLPPHVRPGDKRGTILKKGITLIAALVAVLAVTSGAFAAANHYLITSSSQIKDGAVSAADLSPAARNALQGQAGNAGAAGPQGLRRAGSEGRHRRNWPAGVEGRPRRDRPARVEGRHRRCRFAWQRRRPRQRRYPGQGRQPGFSPTAFGLYASDSPDSSICGNDWAIDTMDRSYVVYPQVDGSFLVAETFTNGTFTTVAGNSPEDSACGSTADDVAAGITGAMKGYFLVKVPAEDGNFDPEAKCTEKCYTKDFVQAFFGTTNYDVPVYELHYRRRPRRLEERLG